MLDEECILCAIAIGSATRENIVVHNPQTLIFDPKVPVVPGHKIVSSVTHTPSTDMLSHEPSPILHAISSLTQRMKSHVFHVNGVHHTYVHVTPVEAVRQYGEPAQDVLRSDIRFRA